MQHQIPDGVFVLAAARPDLFRRQLFETGFDARLQLPELFRRELEEFAIERLRHLQLLFRDELFFVPPRLAEDFAPPFFADDFLAALFRAPPFFAPPFLAAPLFADAPFLGMLAPDSRASLSAIAIACFGFLTFFFPPDFNWPCLYSCMTLPTFARPLVDFFVAK